MVRRSFAAFQARKAQRDIAFEQKVAALESILAQNVSNLEVAGIAASTGLPDAPLLAIQQRISSNVSVLPTTIPTWIDWLVDYFIEDRSGYLALIGADADIVNYVVRGRRKKGNTPTADEFGRLKAGLKAWVSGRPFNEIEIALGVASNKLKSCPRARDLVLKLANRTLYLIAASVAEVARLEFASQNLAPLQLSVLETLPVAIRKGLDSPDKVAFAYLRPTVRSRVLLHQGFGETLGAPADTSGMDYATVLSHTTARLLFANVRLN